jgi:hypothetical protein
MRIKHRLRKRVKLNVHSNIIENGYGRK